MGIERYQIKIAYDGTNFHGFQRQGKNRTVQGEIEKALKQLSWQGKSILAAGRTDTGVHASGQVIALDLDWAHSMLDMRNALNAHLPQDIAVIKVDRAAPDFHPRFNAYWRSYEYRLFYSQIRNPLRERFAWRVDEQIDKKVIKIAAELICGTHDFSAFGTAADKVGSTIRTVYRADWNTKKLDEAGEIELRFCIVANSFLYHMVRRLVFMQVLVGQRRLELASIEAALNNNLSTRHGLAPAHGLCLLEIGFSNDYG
jgi:tRNA pseudouridine38-40 synthase